MLTQDNRESWDKRSSEEVHSMQSILRISLLTCCMPRGDTTGIQPALELTLGPEYLSPLSANSAVLLPWGKSAPKLLLL